MLSASKNLKVPQGTFLADRIGFIHE